MAPAQSPDLNPIELVWADMKRTIRKRFCTNREEVIEAIGDYAATLTAEKCQKFIKHLYKVVEIVIEKKGAWSNH